MDMHELDTQVDNELFEERVKFVKSILKEKSLEMDALTKKIDALVDRLDEVEDDYEKLLTMTVDDVYDKYTKHVSACELYGSFVKIDTPIISTRKY